jgi:leucyl aminopeptidase (aminopeptidase T)
VGRDFNSGVTHFRPAIVLPLVLLALGLALHAQPRLTLDASAMARTIVQRLALTPGERVLSIAHPGLFPEIVQHLRYEVMRAGGIDLGVVDVLQEPVPASFDTAVLQKGARAAREHYKAMFRDVDAAVMMPGANTSHPAYLAMQDLLKDDIKDRRGRRTIHFHWVEAGSAYPLPGQPLPTRPEIDALYQRALLGTDYAGLGEAQRRFASALRGSEVRITSAAGTDLRFRAGDRPVNLQDGDASKSRAAAGVVLIDKEIELPAGAIRVAPLEESVEGVIAFPPSQWDGRQVEGLRLRFARGQVVEVTAASGRDAVEAEMQAAGAAGRAFREFALGLNPQLAVPDRFPWIPYYGYGSGVVRLSLGDNTELGGKVTGGYVRWNFFTDLTVQVGSTVWVKNGRAAALVPGGRETPTGLDPVRGHRYRRGPWAERQRACCAGTFRGPRTARCGCQEGLQRDPTMPRPTRGR